MSELPKGSTELSRDPRPILRIMNGAGVGYQVGKNADSIEAYDESGDMASVPWIAVYQGGKIAMRIRADYVVVYYSIPEQAEAPRTTGL